MIWMIDNLLTLYKGGAQNKVFLWYICRFSWPQLTWIVFRMQRELQMELLEQRNAT